MFNFLSSIGIMTALSNGESKPSFMISMLPLILIFLAFYFLIIYPQLKSQKRHKSFIQNLQNGDKVITNGGVHGIITGVEDKTVRLKIASNVVIVIDKSAIAGIDSSAQQAEKDSK